MVSEAKGDRLGIAAMAVGICGIALFWLLWVNLTVALLSVIFGSIGLREAGSGNAMSKIRAVTGLVLGWVLVLIGLFVIDVALSLAPVLGHSGQAGP